MLRPYPCIVAALMVAGCVSRTVRPREVTALAGAGVRMRCRQWFGLALTLDAAGDRQADTLYAADALVVGNARVRLAAPRFAGITIGGRVTIPAAKRDGRGTDSLGLSGLPLGQPGRTTC